MKENEKILKELRKREFKSLLQNKEFLAEIVSKVLNLDKEYIEKSIKLKKQNQYSKYDLITKITETRIKIRTSKYNRIIQNISDKGKFYIAWYDEKLEEFKIKIYLDKIFEHCYKDVQKKEEKQLQEIFKNQQLNKDDLTNLSILKISLMHSDNIKISVTSKI